MHYARLHGCQNAYVYVDAEAIGPADPGEVAQRISAPRARGGVGSDGLIIVGPSRTGDVRMRMFNADGSQGAMCGNGVRALAKWVLEREATTGCTLVRCGCLAEARAAAVAHCPPLACALDRWPLPAAGLIELRRLRVETDSGVKTIHALCVDGSMRLAAVDMGMVTRALEGLGPARPRTTSDRCQVSVDGVSFTLDLISVGNLHAVIGVEDVDAVDLQRVGSAIERHAIFPDRTNVNFVQRIDAVTFRQRTWERGSGATQACGTGACASAFAFAQDEELVEVRQPGGSVLVFLDPRTSAGDRRAHLIGDAELTETGDWVMPA